MTKEAKFYGSELPVAVFAHFTRRHFKISDPTEIVAAFYRARKTNRFNVFFSNYHFDEDGVDPRCESLSRGLQTLQGTMLLGRMNPYLVKYSISPKVKDDYEESLRSKVTNKSKLRQLAKYVQRQLDSSEHRNRQLAALDA
jgi:hypothetical protein